MVFNDLYYGRRWCVMQPWLMGITHSAASRNAQLYDRSAGTIETIDYEGQIVTIKAVDDARRGLFDPDYATEVEIGSKRDDITEIFIQMGSLLQGWIGGGNAFWESSNPNTFIQTTEGGYIEDGGEDILQDTILVKKGKYVRLTFDFEYALEYTVAGGGTHQMGLKLIADPLDPSGTTYYSTTGSSPNFWDTPDVTLLSNIQTPDANGTPPASLTWHTYNHILGDYMQADGRIRMQIFGDTGTDYYLHLRNFHLELNDQAASAITDTPPWQAHGASPAVGGSIDEGPTVKYQREWHPVTLERTAPNEFVGVEIDTIGTGIWQLPAKWLDSSSVGQAGPYSDMNELIIRERIARGVGGRLIRGTYKGILTPAIVMQALGGRYLPIYLSVDVHTELTEFLVYEEALALAES